MKKQNDILKQNVTNGFHQSGPSSDFTDKIMSRIEVIAETKAVYKPLISKKWWTIVGITSITLILCSFIIESKESIPNLFDDITLPSFEDYKTSFQLSGLILIILISLTITDLIYRKYKHIT
jgi:hypothetical protein